MAELKAIETAFDGYRFRSRLEARWAVFFKVLGIPYEYEKEGYNLGDGILYLPDFWLPEQKLWVEIKGQEATEGERDKARRLCETTADDVVVFVGTPWFNIAHALYTWVRESDKAREVSCYQHQPEDDYYDYSKRDGHGCYYQGWSTWGIEADEKPRLLCLVEGCDVEAAHDSRLVAAYAAARSARFEHGERP